MFQQYYFISNYLQSISNYALYELLSTKKLKYKHGNLSN